MKVQIVGIIAGLALAMIAGTILGPYIGRFPTGLLSFLIGWNYLKIGKILCGQA